MTKDWKTTAFMDYSLKNGYYEDKISEIKDKILEIRNKTIDRLLDFGITLENKLLKQDKILPNNEILEDISIVKKDITRILDDFKTGEEDKVYAIRSKKLYKDFWEKYKEIENRME